MLRHARSPRKKSRGQNLVELGLTLPFVILLLFFIIELGRAFFVYNAAKMAANEGAHAATVYQNPSVGRTQLTRKVSAAGLTATTATVSQIPNQHAYRADVTVPFKPFFGGISIPTVSGSIPIIPKQFDIQYTAIENVAVY
jgi:Flp pilus assembly protein TadG